FGQEVQDARGLLTVSTNLSEVYRLLSVPVGDLIRLQARLKGGETAQAFRWIREFELDPILPRRLHEISTGQAKLVSNLLALDHDPRLLLLDEPFENVDLVRRRRLVSLLRQARGSVLLNTHEFELLRHFEDWQLGFLLEGKFLGPYAVSDLDRLFLSRGELPGSLGQIRTQLGIFSSHPGPGGSASQGRHHVPVPYGAALMNVLRPFLKAMLTNPSLWFWGVAFMAFWLVLGAFVFSSGLPPTAIPGFTASWFAVISLFSLSTLAIGVSASIAYATAALAYAFRFTRLRPRDYLFSLLAGTGVLGLTLTVIMLGSTVGVFGARFHLTLLPADPVALVGAAVLAGAFMMALSVTLMLLV
ncbi:ABC transporter, partial [mine drainage metagenome]